MEEGLKLWALGGADKGCLLVPALAMVPGGRGGVTLGRLILHERSKVKVQSSMFKEQTYLPGGPIGPRVTPNGESLADSSS